MSFDLYSKFLSYLPIDIDQRIIVKGYTGKKLSSLGSIPFVFRLNNSSVMHHVQVIPGVSHQLLIGMDFITAFSGIIDTRHELFHFRDSLRNNQSVPMYKHDEMTQQFKVTSTMNLIVPGKSEVISSRYFVIL